MDDEKSQKVDPQKEETMENLQKNGSQVQWELFKKTQREKRRK